jgi:hypothetical protein
MNIPKKLLTPWIAPALALIPTIAFSASDLDPGKYDKLFPQYAELCAGSQYRDQVDGNGGPNGHAVLFLKGACRIKDAQYPQLKVCDDGPGVGVSTYFAFKNVLWVATEGREFFLRGGLKPNSSVSQKEIDAVIKGAQDQGILRNVEMHDWIMDGLKDNKWNALFGKQEDSDHFKYRMSLGTDWAVGLARNLYCSRIPMTKNMMEKAVAHLNQENRKAFHREKGYENGYTWDVAANNCMHTAYNALAAAGMWPEKKIKHGRLGIILSPLTDGNFSLAVPFDTFLKVAKAGAEKSLPDPRFFWRRGPVEKAIHEDQWILQQPGTMLVEYPIHKNNNVYFNVDSPHAFVRDQIGSKLDLTPLPIINPAKSNQIMTALFKDKENTDLGANLNLGFSRIHQALNSSNESNDENEARVYEFRNFLKAEDQKARALINQYQTLAP